MSFEEDYFKRPQQISGGGYVPPRPAPTLTAQIIQAGKACCRATGTTISILGRAVEIAGEGVSGVGLITEGVGKVAQGTGVALTRAGSAAKAVGKRLKTVK